MAQGLHSKVMNLARHPLQPTINGVLGVTEAWRDPLGLMLASTGEGVFGVDLDGLCVFINPAGARMIGLEPEQVLGQNMHVLTHHSHGDGAHYPMDDCPIYNAFRQGQPCRIDSEVFWRADGRSFPVEYSSYPVFDQGQVRGAVVTFVDITERKQAEHALHQAKNQLEQRVAERTQALETALQQLRELAAWSEAVREEERTRIAREVHDELGSLLVALKMDVGWLDKRLSEQAQRAAEEAQSMREKMRGKCQNMSRLIENAVVNVGRIITDLRPSILDHQGLWDALAWQAQEFVQSAEQELKWCMDVNVQRVLPEPLAMAVFRIFQEMLSNVGRHARARTLDVDIVEREGWLHLSVEDDGCGAEARVFESAQAYGIMGMRERARHFGGVIDIDSQPRRGTRMRLSLPMPHHPETP
ncbi:PAS domain-containing sensor histidine kinase [Limnohabitans sp. Hippo3]|uniref:sensor histidine kinase n=1 Tax=Limnohabitans sp. Hippo3 TaxID=1597956 RepID=UPI000D39B0D1|nr:PAS domain-containing sensor histidine kinase [Limnohabitans sp. Hippo3]PUE38927.1 histidine kinase [Limnohabitans sp. Hippo3]